MKILITGGSASGKSYYAEELAMRLAAGRKLIYLAAMKPYGEESLRRIRRHRELRRGKGFETIEAYTCIDENLRHNGYSDDTPEVTEKPTILLECLPNLAANELFSDDGNMRDPIMVYKKLINEIERTAEAAENIIIVTNDIFSDGVMYPDWTAEYIKILSGLNAHLSNKADNVTEVVYTVPVLIKGDIV